MDAYGMFILKKEKRKSVVTLLNVNSLFHRFNFYRSETQDLSQAQLKKTIIKLFGNENKSLITLFMSLINL